MESALTYLLLIVQADGQGQEQQCLASCSPEGNSSLHLPPSVDTLRGSIRSLPAPLILPGIAKLGAGRVLLKDLVQCNYGLAFRKSGPSFLITNMHFLGCTAWHARF